MNRGLSRIRRIAILLLATAALAAPRARAKPATPDEPSIRVRYAVVVGARGDAPLPTLGEALSDRQLADYLTGWDPHSDNPEIQRIFALRGLSEVLRQAAVLPGQGGQVEGGTRINGVPWHVALAVRPDRDEALFSVEIRRSGELVSSPRVRGPWGEKTIVSSTERDAGQFVFLVVEADREAAPTGTPPSAPGAAAEAEFPRLRERFQPVYPAEALAAGQGGHVLVRIVVDERGSVAEAAIQRSLAPEFDQSALEAVRRWRFDPARVAGRPVRKEMMITINFVPDGERTKGEAD